MATALLQHTPQATPAMPTLPTPLAPVNLPHSACTLCDHAVSHAWQRCCAQPQVTRAVGRLVPVAQARASEALCGQEASFLRVAGINF